MSATAQRIVEVHVAATINILRNRLDTPSAFSPAAFYRMTASALSGLLLLVAALLLVRRLAGALQAPLPVLMLIAVALSTASVAMAAQFLARKARAVDGQTPASLAYWVLSLSLPVIVFAVSLPGSSALSLAVVWLMVAGAEVGMWQWRSKVSTDNFLHRRNNNSISTGPWRRRRFSETNIIGTAPSIPSGSLDDAESQSLPLENKDSTQELTYRTADGKLIVEGWFRIALTTGQRIATAHTAFCPAFERVPQVDAEPVETSDCTIQPALVLPWGVRWEIKFDSPVTAQRIVAIEFIAQET